MIPVGLLRQLYLFSLLGSHRDSLFFIHRNVHVFLFAYDTDSELAQRVEVCLSTKSESYSLRVVDEFPPFDQDTFSQIALMRDGR